MKRVISLTILVFLMLSSQIALVQGSYYKSVKYVREGEVRKNAGEKAISRWTLRSDEGLMDAGIPVRLDLRNKEALQRFAWCDGDYVKLVIGVDVPKLQLQKLRKIVSKEGGEIVDVISMGDYVRAVTVRVTIEDAYVFANKIRTFKQVEYVEPDVRVEAFFTPDDEYWSIQWGPQKIEADFAWNTTIGSSDVLVAIIDTGIDYTHQDLAGNYVALGYDWVNNDTDPMDDHGHGTHCAGIVAAILNNSVGIAGLAQVRIMAQKVLNSYGYGSITWVAQAIINSTDLGAKIISMSLGTYFEPPQFFYDAIKYAYDNGVLLVAAAGNSGGGLISWPAHYEEVIAVSATDAIDNLAPFSSRGNAIELSAPGVNIYSTLPGNQYGYASGTSMACPHVSGVAALIWSAYPNFTRDKVRTHLQLTTDDLGEPGRDPYFGYGRINARRAVGGIPEHDIGITSWQYPSRLTPGQVGTFNLTVANNGKNNETNISVQFFINETLTDAKTIDFLKNGTSTQVSFSWNTTIPAKYNVTCYVLPVPGENFTKNNVVSCDVLVRNPTTLIVPDDYATIQDALDHSIRFDTIFVRSGLYNESVVINTDSIRLIGENKSTTIISAEGNPLGICINTRNITVSGFTIKDAYFCGILVYYPEDIPTENFIHDNIITENYMVGISLEREGNILRNNVLYNNGGGNIYIHGSQSVYFQDIDTSNTIEGKPVYYLIKENNTQIPLDAGYVALVHCENITVKGLNLTRNSPGLLIAYSRNITVENCTISDNGFSNGIEMVETENVTIKWNKISSNGDCGIYAKKCYFLNIINNTISDNMKYGIRLIEAGGNEITGNVLTLNRDYGISLENSKVNIIKNNTISNTGTYGNIIGLKLDRSDSNILKNNVFLGEKQQHLKIYGTLLSHYIQDIDTTNTVNGKPIYYLVNKNNMILDGKTTSFGYLALVNSTNITVRKVEVKENGHALLIAFSTNITVTSCLFSNYNCYTKLYEANFITITRSEITNLRLEKSDHNIFENNEMKGDPAVNLQWSHNNTFVGNTLRPPGTGWPSTNLELTNSNENFFTLNNFLAIEVNGFHVKSTNSTNVWDDGTKGNYWSQYHGVDNDGNSIGDTPYIINENNKDNYPLMVPYIQGDITGSTGYPDGIVDILDVATIAYLFGVNYPDPAYDSKCDLNQDQKIDVIDVATAAINFGKTVPPP